MKDINYKIKQDVRRSASKNEKGTEGLNKSFLLDKYVDNRRQKLREESKVEFDKNDIKSDSSVGSHNEIDTEELETAFYNH